MNRLAHRGRIGRLTLASAAFALTAAGLAGCSSDQPASTADADAAACPITVPDGWVKAAPEGMTAAFGTLSNTGGAEVTVTSASTPAATTVELHEVVESGGSMVMQPAEGGFPVPANGTTSLEPGGLHLMLMDLTAPIKAGQQITVTLTCSGGGSATMTATAKNYTGADEKYPGKATSEPMHSS